MRRYAVRILLGAMVVLAGSNASAQSPAVTVYFGDSAYSANEGGSVAVQVQLSANPERTVTIPLEATPGAGAGTGDFRVVPAQVTFDSGETSKSVTFTATDDTEDDDDETVELSFGTLPEDVSEGSPGTTIVTIADNDEAVTVSFGSATYAVTEGWTVDVMVTLDVDPERTVTIPVQASPAAAGDYSIPGSVRFDAGETQKPANFATVDDTLVESAETFTVTTLGEEFVKDGTGETVVEDFPSTGETVRLVWQEANQNFVLAPLDREPPPASPPSPAGGPTGALENPGPASFQSGLGLLSGWVCEADSVELEINGGPRVAAAYGTDRADTADVCGDTDNGFGLLFNWNLLGDGVQTVRALADGDEFGRATFTVTTLGVEFLQGAAAETAVADFPSAGETVRLIWQQSSQNFVIIPGE